MELEYFQDRQQRFRPVLLTWGDNPNEAALLRTALKPLASGDTDQRVHIDTLSGFRGVNNCTLMACLASSDIGIVPIDQTDLTFRCALQAATWLQIVGLLEPFTTATRADTSGVHQYLTSDGPIDWIIATSRHW